MNVYQAAGNAARSEIERNNLVNAARKMINAENKMPAKLAKEKDMEVGRLLSSVLSLADNQDQQAIDQINVDKMYISLVNVLGGIAGGAIASAGSDMSAASNALQMAGDILGAVIDVGNIIIQYVESQADKDKTQANRKTLADESKNIDASVNALDTRGKA